MMATLKRRKPGRQLTRKKIARHRFKSRCTRKGGAYFGLQKTPLKVQSVSKKSVSPVKAKAAASPAKAKKPIIQPAKITSKVTKVKKTPKAKANKPPKVKVTSKVKKEQISNSTKKANARKEKELDEQQKMGKENQRLLDNLNVKSCKEIRDYLDLNTSLSPEQKVFYIKEHMGGNKALRKWVQNQYMTDIDVSYYTKAYRKISVLLGTEIKNAYDVFFDINDLKDPDCVPLADMVRKFDEAEAAKLHNSRNIVSRAVRTTLGTAAGYLGTAAGYVQPALNVIYEWMKFLAEKGFKAWNWIANSPKTAFFVLLMLKRIKAKACTAVGSWLGASFSNSDYFKGKLHSLIQVVYPDFQPDISDTVNELWYIVADIYEAEKNDFILKAANHTLKTGLAFLGTAISTMVIASTGPVALFSGGIATVFASTVPVFVGGIITILTETIEGITEEAAHQQWADKAFTELFNVINPVNCIKDMLKGASTEIQNYEHGLELDKASAFEKSQKEESQLFQKKLKQNIKDLQQKIRITEEKLHGEKMAGYKNSTTELKLRSMKNNLLKLESTLTVATTHYEKNIKSPVPIKGTIPQQTFTVMDASGNETQITKPAYISYGQTNIQPLMSADQHIATIQKAQELLEKAKSRMEDAYSHRLDNAESMAFFEKTRKIDVLNYEGAKKELQDRKEFYAQEQKQFQNMTPPKKGKIMGNKSEDTEDEDSKMSVTKKTPSQKATPPIKDVKYFITRELNKLESEYLATDKEDIDHRQDLMKRIMSERDKIMTDKEILNDIKDSINNDNKPFNWFKENLRLIRESHAYHNKLREQQEIEDRKKTEDRKRKEQQDKEKKLVSDERRQKSDERRNEEKRLNDLQQAEQKKIKDEEERQRKMISEERRQVSDERRRLIKQISEERQQVSEERRKKIRNEEDLLFQTTDPRERRYYIRNKLQTAINRNDTEEVQKLKQIYKKEFGFPWMTELTKEKDYVYKHALDDLKSRQILLDTAQTAFDKPNQTKEEKEQNRLQLETQKKWYDKDNTKYLELKKDADPKWATWGNY